MEVLSTLPWFASYKPIAFNSPVVIVFSFLGLVWFLVDLLIQEMIIWLL